MIVKSLDVKMAEKNVTSSESDNEQKSGFNMGNPGHTMSDSSSSELNVKKKTKTFKKTQRVPKLVVEKRPVSSSDESDKENKKKKNGN